MSKLKLVFDIDGVLIDTRLSYRHAIKQTAQFFLQEKVAIKDVDYLKRFPGMNNDWHAAYIFINCVLKRISLDKYDLITSQSARISYEIIKTKFQELYLGCEQGDGTKTKYEKGGLWERETLIFSKEQLHKLSKETGMLSIITGRTIEEADFALRHLGVREFFDSITSVEAQSEPMDKSDVRLLSQVPNVTSFDRILYFGDNISDLQLVQNARHIYPIESVWFVKTLGIMPVSYVKHVQKAYAPSFVARTSIEAVSLVIK